MSVPRYVSGKALAAGMHETLPAIPPTASALSLTTQKFPGLVMRAHVRHLPKPVRLHGLHRIERSAWLYRDGCSIPVVVRRMGKLLFSEAMFLRDQANVRPTEHPDRAPEW